MIIRLGVGFDHIDIKAARRLSVDVANTPGANANAVAEHALMLTFAAARCIGRDNAAMHNGKWSPSRPKDLTGSTFGLVGMGNIGRRYSELIRPLTTKILAYDPYLRPADADKYGVKLCTYEEVLQNSDVLSFHLPLTEQTRGLVGRKAFSMVKHGAILINTSRGEIVDETALCQALSSGTLAAAGLDVYCKEPIDADCPLCAYENCIMTPHDASLSEAAFRNIVRVCMQGIYAHITGEGAVHIVNR